MPADSTFNFCPSRRHPASTRARSRANTPSPERVHTSTLQLERTPIREPVAATPELIHTQTVEQPNNPTSHQSNSPTSKRVPVLTRKHGVQFASLCANVFT